MKELEQLVKILSRMPGLGPRSAKRFALALIKKPDSLLNPLIGALSKLEQVITLCTICGNIDNVDPCAICQDNSRDQHQLCVVEEVGDLWALERAGGYRGQYHILGGCLSALDGIGPETLNLSNLMIRLNENDLIKELIIATNLTVDGQTTAHYISEMVETLPLEVTRLAHGVPIGGELDYLDDGTLRAALTARRQLI
ncbi:MAG: recombination mediator RecR [Alphaproteobacteria bacterium]